MNVYRSRKMAVLLTSLEIPKAGLHSFRHFNVALMDAQRVPLKTIQERLCHSLTGSFTLDVYGGKPEWEPNREAARLIATDMNSTTIGPSPSSTILRHNFALSCAWLVRPGDNTSISSAEQKYWATLLIASGQRRSIPFLAPPAASASSHPKPAGCGKPCSRL